MSAVVSDNRWATPQLDRKTRLDQERNEDYEEPREPMTKAEMAEMADLRDTVHNISASVMLLTKLQSPPQSNGSSKWAGWIQTGVLCGMLLVTGTNTFKSSEGELNKKLGDVRTDIAVMAEKLAQSEERQKERDRISDRERALLDERYRQVSIALQAKGIKLPNL